MAQFTYTARKKTGEKVEGTIDAADRRVALAQIERLGLLPVSIADIGGAPDAKKEPAKAMRLQHTRTRMTTRELLLFTTELSDLLASGMTLGNALNCLSSRKTGGIGETIITQLRDEIVRGTSLSNALSLHPKTFSRLYVSMIRAGEASGAIDEVLRRLVEHYERFQETKEKIVMALVYPSIVMFMGFVTLIFSMVFVLPKFKTIFDNIGQALPLPTRMLIATSDWTIKYGLIFLAVAGVGIGLVVRTVKTTDQGRLWWHGLVLKMPLIRGVIASGIFANLARTLGTLLSNGVPAVSALAIVEQTVGNTVIAHELRKARERVTDGTTISAPLAAGKIFPSMMTDMLAIGEQTGDMSGALKHISRRYENELDRNLRIFTTALEPIMIVIVAVLVGFVAISILMAVFSMTNGLG